jgi:hypothetical protein
MKKLNWRQPLTIGIAIAAVCALFAAFATGNLGHLMTALAASGVVFGMILDERSEFADALALNTGAAGKYLIGDVIDLGSIGRNIGTGRPIYLVITVDTLPTSGGAATAAFTLASDAQAAIAVDGTETAHFTTKAFAIAEMAAGAVLAVIALPLGGPTYERFLGIIQTTGTAAFTAGKINAFLTTNPKVWRAYADGNAGI